MTSPRTLNPQLSAPFEHFLVKLLDKERESRPSSAREALRLLEPAADAAPMRKIRRIVAVKTSATPFAPMLLGGLIVVAALGIIAYLATHRKPAPEKSAAAAPREPQPEPTAPPPPKQRARSVHPSEQRDFDRLEILRVTEPPSVAIDAHTEFLQKHPSSDYCETVLVNKMELQRELERQNTKRVPDPVRPPAPPPARPVEPAKPTLRFLKPLTKSPDGVPCRPLPPPVRDGLVWLARHQADGGTWEMELYPQLCTGANTCALNQEMGSNAFHAGVNSLALLAFLGAGIGLNDRDETGGVNLGDAVREGVRTMVRSQNPNGSIGNIHLPKYIYGQCLAVHALAEAVRSLSSGSVIPADEARDPGGAAAIDAVPGLGAEPGGRLALISARAAGARVPDAVFDYGLAWFESVTDLNDQRVGYNARGTGKVFVPG